MALARAACHSRRVAPCSIAAFKNPFENPGFDAGARRGVWLCGSSCWRGGCGAERHAQRDLTSRNAQRAIYRARQRLQINVGATFHLSHGHLRGLAVDNESAILTLRFVTTRFRAQQGIISVSRHVIDVLAIISPSCLQASAGYDMPDILGSQRRCLRPRQTADRPRTYPTR